MVSTEDCVLPEFTSELIIVSMVLRESKQSSESPDQLNFQGFMGDVGIDGNLVDKYKLFQGWSRCQMVRENCSLLCP